MEYYVAKVDTSNDFLLFRIVFLISFVWSRFNEILGEHDELYLTTIDFDCLIDLVIHFFRSKNLFSTSPCCDLSWVYIETIQSVIAFLSWDLPSTNHIEQGGLLFNASGP